VTRGEESERHGMLVTRSAALGESMVMCVLWVSSRETVDVFDGGGTTINVEDKYSNKCLYFYEY
jgi:hypothetical protein